MKYLNKKTVVDGITFDSKREAARFGELKLLQRAGLISDLELQPEFVLAPSVKFAGATRAKPALKYKADFRYRDLRKAVYIDVVEDVKSPATAALPAFQIKRHLMLSELGIDVLVTK